MSPVSSQLNFELNLRNYKSITNFKGEEPFYYPKTKHFKAVETDKSVFPWLPKLFKTRDSMNLEGGETETKSVKGSMKDKASEKYMDKFRGDNMMAVRHLIQRPVMIQNS